MRYPDDVVRRRALTTDPYRNPGGSFEEFSELSLPAFVTFGDEGRAKAYLAPGSDVRHGDRLLFEGELWHVDGPPKRVRSPAKEVLLIVTLDRVPNGA